MGLAASIATVLLSGVVAALISFLLNATKEETLAQQRKAEELYNAFVQFDKELQGTFFMRMAYFAGKVTKNDFNDHVITKSDRNAGGHFDRIDMLVHFYFPELQKLWADYLAARDRVNAAASAAEQDRAKKKDYDKAVLRMSPPGDVLKGAIIEIGRRYARLHIIRRAFRFK